MYTALRDELAGLVSTTWSERQAELSAHTGAGPLDPLDAGTLKDQVRDIWKSLPQDPSSSKSTEVIRATLDLVRRDIAVRPVMNLEIVEPSEDASDADKAAFQTTLQDRLDIVLTLFEVVYEGYEDNAEVTLEPGAVFIPLLEEFVELLLVSTWHELFTYVETRAPRFTKDMPSSKGKALPLLRTINAFLRILSHTPEDLTLRGRVQLFASRAISVADKSATNLHGVFSQIVTEWEEPETEVSAEAQDGDGDGDVQMEDGNGDKSTKPDFYSTLWSLQQFFAHPPSLDGEATGEPAQTPFEIFRTKSDFVLARLFEQTGKEHALLEKNPELKRKRDDDDGFEMSPRYLTARSLLEYEISDLSFRRQILLQFFILFQFLLNLTPASANKQQFTGGMPKTFVVDGENQTWIKRTVSKVREELRRMQPGGREFEATVVQLMDRERRYAQWKNDGCPESEWELPIADSKDAISAAQKWKRHCAPARKWPYKLGTAALSRTWETGYKSMDDFFHHPVKKQTVFELEEELTRIEVEEDDERGFGREPPPELMEQKRTVKWLALRAARISHPRLVAMKGIEYDLHELVNTIKGRGKKSEAEVEAAEPDAEAEVAAEAEAEVAAEAEQEAGAEQEVEGEGEGEEAAEEVGKPEEVEVMAEGSGEGEDEEAKVVDDSPADVSPGEQVDAPEEVEESGTVPDAEPLEASGDATPNGHSDSDVQMRETAPDNDLSPLPEELPQPAASRNESDDDLTPPPEEDGE